MIRNELAAKTVVSAPKSAGTGASADASKAEEIARQQRQGLSLMWSLFKALRSTAKKNE